MATKKIYRLKHIPTGLYFTPSKGKGNLSVNGKYYVGKKPSLDWVSVIRVIIYPYLSKALSKIHKLLIDVFGLDKDKKHIDVYLETKPEDWVIEESEIHDI